ncbi:MAG: hypothetical protein HY863_03040 [Chloroflexi bacterium]|nr:hypothetical protein [Chloroflexota bacterium]
MKRLQYFALFVLLLILACGTMPGTAPTATPSPEPTSTFTPMPTSTPTAVPTATINIAATVEAKQTQIANDVLGDLDKVLGDSEIPYKEGHLAWHENKEITVSLSGPDWNAVDVEKKLTASDFILKSDVTWNASGIIVCGAIFRSEPNLDLGKQYQFLYLRLSGLPAWAIEVHEFGRYKNSPTSVQYSSAVNQDNGATNQFIIVAQDEQLTVYINGVRQGKYYDNSRQRTEGSIGFFGFQDSGKGSCKFENSWVWELK